MPDVLGSAEVKEKAKTLGADLCGIADVESFPGALLLAKKLDPDPVATYEVCP
ncbi:hypothetical protein J2128_002173 [Methanomicrobium sp. W14]|uniref:hypothetical protein n=1 Tax=Methanomicrobium sp. W14 TaxID=2817839 RepID=UPI001AE521E4|nr:hypothetical protein [Methanomicrobium sp. W14]MBP2134207.1 hypothetical protein [Methanomicrobium sp. W14]